MNGHDRNPVEEKPMTNDSVENNSATPTPEAARALEDEAVRRARVGIRKPVLHKGKQVYVQGEPMYTTEYSDSLLMFLLKAYNPERFRDRMEQTNLLDITVEMLTCEQLDALAEHLIRKERGHLSAEEMAKAKLEIKAAGDAGETVEATVERTDGEDGTRDAAASDADWFDEVSQ
jgi:hypothetical protein